MKREVFSDSNTEATASTMRNYMIFRDSMGYSRRYPPPMEDIGNPVRNAQ